MNARHLIIVVAIGSFNSVGPVGPACAEVSGEGGCFDCVATVGQALEESFAETDPDVLARQAWAGELCFNHPCIEGGIDVTEQNAKDLLQDFFVREQRARDFILSISSVLLAALSVIISVFALRQTHIASQVAHAASDRSIRNEVQIKEISEEV